MPKYKVGDKLFWNGCYVKILRVYKDEYYYAYATRRTNFTSFTRSHYRIDLMDGRTNIIKIKDEKLISILYG